VKDNGMHTEFYVVNLKTRHHAVDFEVDGIMIGQVMVARTAFRYVCVSGYYKHNNGTFDSLKGIQVLDQLRYCKLSKEGRAPWS
jgi:hypothetical protein